MTPIVHIRRAWRRARWYHDAGILPGPLGWLARHRREAAALSTLALFAFTCAFLATVVAVSDPEAFTGWALILLLVAAAMLASLAGHLLIELAGYLGRLALELWRRRSA